MKRSPEKSYALDSMIGVWAIKDKPSEHDAETASKAVKVFNHLREKEYGLYLPAPVVTELMSACTGDKNERNKIEKQIREDFIILPFNYKASLICAKLLSGHYQDKTLQKYLQDQDYTGIKTKMKYDCMIVAITSAFELDGLIANDKRTMTTMARGEINLLSLDDVLEQREFTIFDA